jgi:hypothetical protein
MEYDIISTFVRIDMLIEFLKADEDLPIINIKSLKQVELNNWLKVSAPQKDQHGRPLSSELRLM